MQANCDNWQRVIRMDRGEYTTCTVILKGATITSWRIKDEEQIFMSRISKLDNYHKYRGGICLIFPRFEHWEVGRFHGFARDLMWGVKRGPYNDKEGNVHLDMILTSDCFTRSCWNCDFEIHYSLILKTSELETKIEVVNLSPSTSFQFHLEQHWHMKVKDVSAVVFKGLKGLTYVDREHVNPDVPFLLCTTNDFMLGDDRTDLTFYNTSPELNIVSEPENKIFRIRKQNMPDLNLWIPGTTECKDSGLEDDEIKHMIVADFGNVRYKKILSPKTTFVATETIEVLQIYTPPPKYSDFLEYFSHIC
ncbi:unnamed protein product [Psylliodes chrysocephalus]|uniref:glucose-6-phosphate 1-epimerase n=1 Tax=Psylliodes chrysocephalus TaxID=3402493 RepID=A0A9P0GK59_9CUCU|nr:unnamed protein product [Psylliodes chrysocephala]